MNLDRTIPLTNPAPSDQPQVVDIEDADKLGLCPYYEGLLSTGKDGILKGVYDLADLQKIGQEKLWCPYYTTRHTIENADVVVLNYHYVLDPKIATIMDGKISENSIIVFDEAHNIDNICIEAMTINLNRNDIYNASKSLNRLRILVQQ